MVAEDIIPAAVDPAVMPPEVKSMLLRAGLPIKGLTLT
ncbi:hypothetical protein PC112_g1411 [Phytophthora cactorum]|nr:hypothetical protein PC112_g1411 [Phytophthora cactorum]